MSFKELAQKHFDNKPSKHVTERLTEEYIQELQTLIKKSSCYMNCECTYRPDVYVIIDAQSCITKYGPNHIESFISEKSRMYANNEEILEYYPYLTKFNHWERLFDEIAPSIYVLTDTNLQWLTKKNNSYLIKQRLH